VVDTAGMPESTEPTAAGTVLSVPAKGLVVLQALAENSLPPVLTAPAAAVPAIPPVPVPTADAQETAPVEQSVVPPAETSEGTSEDQAEEPPAKPKRKRSTTPRAPRKRKTEDASE
jgi:hypothetical protein